MVLHSEPHPRREASGLPFDDIRALMARLPRLDGEAAARAKAREAELVKPAGALGRLEDIAEWLCAWQGKTPPTVARPLVAIFAGAHGVAERGVSAYPPAVTRQMLDAFAGGGAAINQICKSFDIGLKVFDLATERPTPDICEQPAMSEAECAGTMAYGFEAIHGGIDLLVVGEMGIGNTTVASTLAHALFGGRPEDWVGRGTGANDVTLGRKIDAVATAVRVHGPHLGDPLEALRRVGGREFAAIAGAILAARMERVPVVIDGFVATAAAAVLHALDASALEHCVAGHRSAEAAHGRLLERLELPPILDLGMLGEGSGGALAVAVIKAACACHTGMATFAEAAVSNRGG
ncbi:nicotinate-nucleotide--dimethylbenzimidazole phosphoribosyltransferase [Chenggangzhangella methanolivorans]|uniref:Nicotinate-nucleotide--dimethylbenzimidazole phosphoribosyltransferase n=1 Tax=Chenggangzhangella methanolivorans TaxID=1437009 RepID=A0A9E6R9C9_9HYPH|nr:nicotinate-nucleotide--dimethylbenzimidazole phosphoribosyltransferase [Chenggangzhangella methanolivorans]QZO00190.1 nicotinate-nucleotide--dimethylbenzimidazole phosphoribosyltransferase [Chenggangzhangella methanolivorans]